MTGVKSRFLHAHTTHCVAVDFGVSMQVGKLFSAQKPNHLLRAVLRQPCVMAAVAGVPAAALCGAMQWVPWWACVGVGAALALWCLLARPVSAGVRAVFQVRAAREPA